MKAVNVGGGQAATLGSRGQVFVLHCSSVRTQVAEHSPSGVERDSMSIQVPNLRLTKDTESLYFTFLYDESALPKLISHVSL